MSSEEEGIRIRVHRHAFNYWPSFLLDIGLDDNNILSGVGLRFTTSTLPRSNIQNTYRNIQEINDLDFFMDIMGSTFEDMAQRIAETQSAQTQELQRNETVNINISSQRYDTTSKKFDECSICLEKFKPETMVTVLNNCNHIMCTDCLKEWGKYNAVCPLCKVEIPTIE